LLSTSSRRPSSDQPVVFFNMAPQRVAKRPSASTAPAQKKRELGPEEIVAQKCKIVSDELMTSAPEQVADMLAAMVPGSLGVLSDKRHALQIQAVGMIKKTFADIEATLVETVGHKQSAVDTLAEETAAKVAEQGVSETSLEGSQGALSDRKSAMDEAGVALHRATVALTESKNAQLTGDRELVEASERKARLEGVLNGSYDAMKNGKAEDAKRAMAEVLAVAKLFSLDASMLTALPQVLNKSPEARGSFDKMVIESFESETQTRVTELTALLEAGEPSKAERAAAVESATAAHSAAEAALLVSKEAMAAAREDVKRCTADLKEMQVALASLQAKASVASRAVFEAETAMSGFRTGPLATLQELEDRSTPAPEPEAIAKEIEPEAKITATETAAEPDVMAGDA